MFDYTFSELFLNIYPLIHLRGSLPRSGFFSVVTQRSSPTPHENDYYTRDVETLSLSEIWARVWGTWDRISSCVFVAGLACLVSLYETGAKRITDPIKLSFLQFVFLFLIQMKGLGYH